MNFVYPEYEKEYLLSVLKGEILSYPFKYDDVSIFISFIRYTNLDLEISFQYNSTNKILFIEIFDEIIAIEPMAVIYSSHVPKIAQELVGDYSWIEITAGRHPFIDDCSVYNRLLLKKFQQYIKESGLIMPKRIAYK